MMLLKWIQGLSFKKILKEALIMGLIIVVMANVISYFRQPELSSHKLQLERLQTLNSGEVDADMFEDAVMVHFWATWCPVCQTEEGNINFIANHFDVVSVVVKSGADEQVLEYMEKEGVNFTVVNDRYGALASEHDVNVFPTTFIYNSEGELVFTTVGYTSIVGLYLRMWWASL
ncbi:MAG TPA: redoxin domain-containing protein [Helicobacteraceae bacterium]|nr:redoxin domain-containing protein [Helicobacteraceae bacterium]